MEKQRIVYLDNLKFFLILVVVIGHAIYDGDGNNIEKGIYLFIYSFHMPLFLFVSGFFHKNENISNRVFKLIVIAYLCKFISVVEHAIFGSTMSMSIFRWDCYGWFMVAIAVFSFFTYCARNFNLKFLFICAVILSCFAGYDDSVNDFLCLSRIIVFYPFYVLGYWVDKEKLTVILSKLYIKVCACGILLVSLVVSILLANTRVWNYIYMFTGNVPYSQMGFEANGFQRLGCYMLTIIIGFSFMCIIPKKNMGYVSCCGKRTLQVFFWHVPLLVLLQKTGVANWVRKIRGGSVLWCAFWILVTLFLSCSAFSFPIDKIYNVSLRKSEIGERKKHE